MGRLIDGQWTTHDLGPDEKGYYVRRETQFRDWIRADGSTRFTPDPGRYHLYVSHACGWTHRVLLTLALKGLEHAFTFSWSAPLMGDRGWHYPEDELLGVSHLYEVYVRAQADYTGRVSVPTLWDRELETIVSNESIEIIQMLDDQFKDVATVSRRLFPDNDRAAILDMVKANYGPICNGVYRAGFAASQQAHEEAVRALFARMDVLEELLAGQRYLMGNELTGADICLFPSLFRFDPVYHGHFKCNLKRLADYPNLSGYTRDIYQTPGIAETCDLEHAREHYYTSHESISPRRLIPLGPIVDYAAPHDRVRF